MIYSKKDNKKAVILGLNVPKVTAYEVSIQPLFWRFEQ